MSRPQVEINSIAERIRFIRRYRNVTQEALAEMLTVSRGAVALWEQGKRNPDDGRLQQIAHILGVSWSWLAQGDEEFDPDLPGVSGFIHRTVDDGSSQNLHSKNVLIEKNSQLHQVVQSISDFQTKLRSQIIEKRAMTGKPNDGEPSNQDYVNQMKSNLDEMSELIQWVRTQPDYDSLRTINIQDLIVIRKNRQTSEADETDRQSSIMATVVFLVESENIKRNLNLSPFEKAVLTGNIHGDLRNGVEISETYLNTIFFDFLKSRK